MDRRSGRVPAGPQVRRPRASQDLGAVTLAVRRTGDGEEVAGTSARDRERQGRRRSPRAVTCQHRRLRGRVGRPARHPRQQRRVMAIQELTLSDRGPGDAVRDQPPRSLRAGPRPARCAGGGGRRANRLGQLLGHLRSPVIFDDSTSRSGRTGRSTPMASRRPRTSSSPWRRPGAGRTTESLANAADAGRNRDTAAAARPRGRSRLHEERTGRSSAPA